MWPGRFFWKVDGRKRDCSILIGRTPVNVKLARIRSQTRDSKSFQEVGAKSKNLKEGVDVAKRSCSTSSQWKSMEQGPWVTIDGLRKGEKECIEPGAGDADLWIQNWEELHVKRGILVEVAHVKAHRAKKEKKG